MSAGGPAAQPGELGTDLVPVGNGGALQRTRGGRSATAWQRLAGVVALLVLWELASRAGWIDRRTLPAPSTVVDLAGQMIRDGTLRRALWASAQRVLWALAIGAPVGGTLALLAASSKPGDALIDANVQVLRYVPILAVQPLLLRWFGVGEAMKIALLAIAAAFPVYVNTHAAARSIDSRFHDLADVLALTRREHLRRVLAPGALAGFLVGVRYASAVAWLLLVVAEQTNARDGLGQLMAESQAFLRTDRVVVVILTYTVLGVVSDVVIRSAERWLLRWRRQR